MMIFAATSGAQLFFDQVMNGVGTGVIYASVALSLVLIYRTTGLLNFAQGELALFSTFITYWFAHEQGLPIVAALLASVAVSFVGGALIERVLIRPVEGASSPLNVVIVTLGLFLAVNALASLIFIKPGQEALQMPRIFPTGDLALGIRTSTVGFAAVLVIECLLLYLLLQKTKLGLALRAVASNPESAKLVGINTGTMLMVGWALAAPIGAVAGSLAATRQSGFDASLMQQVLVYAFAAAALGGFDSPLGAVVGGLIVGIADSLTIQYVDALDGIELVVPFVLILVVLLVRPNGLFGRTIVERV
ncbi:branched-chain amino acid ABC transporter permease [Aquihabitans sp. G128]|uniref:branched-chain amino acid ABC transporter permease n=1 Tax=Aquihabitans sp. G128 TaxID=2849779 RepID=UPI001C218389|nr:branched-chain amino acid ABC transporter permease [Aquihabitans sp. G128]QXC60460.1 branched-chain amino acid ABC transporter permease [Aquihabitans sp. G128]